MPREDPYSRLQVYRQILAQQDADDVRRTHHRTQPGKPSQARQWLRKSRQLRLVESLVRADERFSDRTRA